MPRRRPLNPLNGITLEMMLEQLMAYMGWEAMGMEVPIRCFTHDPSIQSSLRFLRKTPWARTKVEWLYRNNQKKMNNPANDHPEPLRDCLSLATVLCLIASRIGRNLYPTEIVPFKAEHAKGGRYILRHHIDGDARLLRRADSRSVGNLCE